MLLPLNALHAVGYAALRLQGAKGRELRAGRRRMVVFEKEGSGKGPPVLLVHGLGGSANSFLPLVTPLARISRRVMVPDLPGHGTSSVRHGEPHVGFEELPGAVLAALDALEAPALVVGNSLGGALGLHALLERPEKVLGWVGLAPAGAPLTEQDRAGLRHSFSGGGTDAARELNRRLWHRTPRAAWLVMRDFGRYWKIPAVQAMVAEVLSAEVELGLDRLRNAPRPALVLWGESDRLLPWSSVAFFRQHLGDAAVEIVPRCGHLPQLERPRLVLSRLERFVRELPA